MKTKYHSIYRIIVLLSCLLAASWAQAATFNLTFFDMAKNVAGKGQFSFIEGTEKTVCLEGVFTGCDSSDPSRFDPDRIFTIKNPLTSLSVTFYGLETNDGINYQRSEIHYVGNWFPEWPAGWGDASQLPGQVTSGRNGMGYSSFWGLGGQDLYTLQYDISLSFLKSNGVSANGFWNGDILRNFNAPTFGTFTATATPLPAAVWLFLSGLGLFLKVSRKAS